MRMTRAHGPCAWPVRMARAHGPCAWPSPRHPATAYRARLIRYTARMSRRRRTNVAGVLACAGPMCYALYAQYGLGLEPCPLCIFQRIGIILMGVTFLAAALHHARGGGRYVYGA